VRAVPKVGVLVVHSRYRMLDPNAHVDKSLLQNQL
jgi:hypothetical protein